MLCYTKYSVHFHILNGSGFRRFKRFIYFFFFYKYQKRKLHEILNFGLTIQANNNKKEKRRENIKNWTYKKATTKKNNMYINLNFFAKIDSHENSMSFAIYLCVCIFKQANGIFFGRSFVKFKFFIIRIYFLFFYWKGKA